MKIINIRFLIKIAFFISLSIAFLEDNGICTTYYVKNTGSDQFSGLSDSDAWKTISKVNSFKFSEGDTVCLKRGDIFHDSRLQNFNVNNFTLRDYGTGAKPIIDGDSVMPILINPKQMIENLTIMNIDISGQDWSPTKSANLSVNRVQNVTLDGIVGNGHAGGNKSAGKNAIAINRTVAGRIEIKNCILYNWGPSDLPSPTGDYVGIALLYVKNGSAYIHDNIVHNVNSDCLVMQGNSIPVFVYNNTFFDAGEDCIDNKGTSHSRIYNNILSRSDSFTGRGGSISTPPNLLLIHAPFDGAITNDVEVYNNKLTVNQGIKAIKVAAGAGPNNTLDGIKIHHNTITAQAPIDIGDNTYNLEISFNIIVTSGTYGIAENNSGSGTKIFNNTIYNASNGQYAVRLNYCKATQVYNNIAFISSTAETAYPLYYSGNGIKPILSFNCWYNSLNSNRVWFAGVSYNDKELSSWINKGNSDEKFSDPLFIDPKQGNFAIAGNSTCFYSDRVIGAVALSKPINLRAFISN